MLNERKLKVGFRRGILGKNNFTVRAVPHPDIENFMVEVFVYR
jgi:phosphoenolpyruvate carboxylase